MSRRFFFPVPVVLFALAALFSTPGYLGFSVVKLQRSGAVAVVCYFGSLPLLARACFRPFSALWCLTAYVPLAPLPVLHACRPPQSVAFNPSSPFTRTCCCVVLPVMLPASSARAIPPVACQSSPQLDFAHYAFGSYPQSLGIPF